MTTAKPLSTMVCNIIPNVADIIERVRSSEDPTILKRRSQLLTTLNRLIRHGAIEPSTTPFIPSVVQGALAGITPGTSGLAKKSIQNDWSNLRFLLEHFELAGLKLSRVELSGEYRAVYERIDDRHLRAAVSRTLRFGQSHGISLAEIDNALASRYRRYLHQDALERDPESSWRSAIRGFNKLRLKFPGLHLQELILPKGRRGWAEPWAAFPPKLVSQIEEYFLSRSVEGDLFDPNAPDVVLRPRTIETQKEWLRTLASAAVRSGIAINALSSLDQLVRPETVESALRWYVEIHKARRTDYVVMLSVEALAVARALGTFTDADIERLHSLVRRLRKFVARTANEPRRIKRLVQFENRKNVLKMLALSEHVVTAVHRRGGASRSNLLLIQLALVHELFLTTSLRRANVAGLNLVEHLIWPAGAEGDRCVIRIPGRHVKNGETIHKDLPSYVVDLLKMYLRDWRPLHPNARSPWLFPGRGQRHKMPSTLTCQYHGFMREWTGLDVTPHLLRSFADMIYTDRHPEGGEVMRRQLGHRSPETRIIHYADPRSRAAGRAYQQLILEERDNALREPALFRQRRRSRSADAGAQRQR